MAYNARAVYGLTVDTSTGDVDEFFSTIDGPEGVAQDALHRLTNKTVLGPGGEDFGVDIREWCGMPIERLIRRGAVVSEVLQRDERVKTADARIRVPTSPKWAALYTAILTIDAMTDAGPFRRVFAFTDKSVADITAIWEGDS